MLKMNIKRYLLSYMNYDLNYDIFNQTIIYLRKKLNII